MRARRLAKALPALARDIALGLVGLVAIVAALAALTHSIIVPVTNASVAGDTVPKGSLIAAVPAGVGDLHVGDVVIVQAPSGARVVGPVARRVDALQHDNGGLQIRTHGDLDRHDDHWTVDLDRAPVFLTRVTVPGLGSAYELARGAAGTPARAAAWAVAGMALSAVARLRRRRRQPVSTELVLSPAGLSGPEQLRLLMQHNPQLAAAFTDLVVGVSRELRGQLTSILGYVELLTDQNDRLTDADMRRAQIIHNHAVRLTVLADDLTAYGETEPRARLALPASGS